MKHERSAFQAWRHQYLSGTNPTIRPGLQLCWRTLLQHLHGAYRNYQQQHCLRHRYRVRRVQKLSDFVDRHLIVYTPNTTRNQKRRKPSTRVPQQYDFVPLKQGFTVSLRRMIRGWPSFVKPSCWPRYSHRPNPSRGQTLRIKHALVLVKHGFRRIIRPHRWSVVLTFVNKEALRINTSLAGNISNW